jgi:NAD(P)-dependent dehydrogenase (short-subunit alcohol dehydrogenase family)
MTNYNGVLQQPIGSGFNAASTTSDIIGDLSLAGKTVIVTGGYAGIGRELTRTFSAAGATVIVPARDLTKAANNLAGLPHVEVRYLNLMEPDSIDAFAETFLASGQPLHLLLNNAGIMWVPLRRDSRGYESQLSTNHLGHFQLTARLWPALVAAGGARVVNVSSFGHQIAPFNFEDPHFLHRDYETLQGYGQAKTANNLFTVALDARGQSAGVRAFAVHPGSVGDTDLGREAPMALFQQMGTHDADGNLYPEVARKLKTTPQGAGAVLWAAVSPQLDGLGGVYCEDCDIAELDTGNIVHAYDEPSTLRGVRPYSLDEEAAGKLWQLSEEWTGVVFDTTVS